MKPDSSTAPANFNRARVALAVYSILGVGPVLFKRCIETLGSEEALLKASSVELASIEGMTRLFAEAWKNKENYLSQADEELALAAKNNIQVVAYGDENYPASLRNIADPPMALFVRGYLAPAEKIIAMVGSRETSEYGEKTASAFAGDFSRAGAVVVSGLARGIDSAAHKGALQAGGVTWAVLGGGLLNRGSYRNPKLADEIVQKGAVISEYPLMETPRPEFYPRRNRIVSGLSSGVVVIEAGRQSGALITAGLALDQGRDVFVVPGNVDSVFSEGSNWLLRQGAKIVLCGADVLEDLGFSSISSPVPRFNLESLTESERSMIQALSPKKPLHLDDWIEQSGRPSSDALAVIGSLVLKGAVLERPGKYYALERR